MKICQATLKICNTEMFFEAEAQKLVQSILVTVFAMLRYNVKIINTSTKKIISRLLIQRCHHITQIHRRLKKYVFGRKCLIWLTTVDSTTVFTKMIQPSYRLFNQQLS